MPRKKKTLNFIDLFAGAGGLSCGLEMAGLKCLLGVDTDKYAMQTFAANHKHAQTYCGDISKLKKAVLQDLLNNQTVDVVVGGPPCQGFSTAGAGNPNDIRNKLFLEFMRIVKITNPSFVVMENVTGLVAKKNEKTLKAIFKKFKSLGYHMNVKVLEASKYGVPEKRRRTIFIGTRLDVEIKFPQPITDTLVGNSFIPSRTVGDALSELDIQKAKVLNHDLESAQIKTKIDKDRIKRVPEGKGIRYQRDEKAYLTRRLYLGVNWDEIPENRFRQTKYRRLDRNLPSPTIMTHRWTYYHPTEPRFLTAREGASLQSFPLDFEFKGPISAQWRQIGNAVPPLLAKQIGLSIVDMLKASKSKKVKKLKRPARANQEIGHIRGSAFHYKEPSQEA